MILRLTEEWKEKLDKEFIAGAVLMDLSKAFDCYSVKSTVIQGYCIAHKSA